MPCPLPLPKFSNKPIAISQIIDQDFHLTILKTFSNERPSCFALPCLPTSGVEKISTSFGAYSTLGGACPTQTASKLKCPRYLGNSKHHLDPREGNHSQSKKEKEEGKHKRITVMNTTNLFALYGTSLCAV